MSKEMSREPHVKSVDVYPALLGEAINCAGNFPGSRRQNGGFGGAKVLAMGKAG